MGLLDALKSMFATDASQADNAYWLYVRSRRCKEVIKTRVDLRNDLSQRDEGGYFTRKVLTGNNSRCFDRVEVTLIFDDYRRLVDQQISGGEFLTAEAYEAALVVDSDPPTLTNPPGETGL
ncbi:MAG: hypothetical protein KDI79_14940 [Anaerolineae bacterium]|nr:hypothetical protein [Anaerolineae bacterium]